MHLDIDELLSIAREAGMAVLDVYGDEKRFKEVQFKSDQSPLTLADEASNRVIVQRLKKFTPDIPILSEEEMDIAYEERKTWKYFWCVDPLDGTKEFISRNGEFTVNIALIKEHVPILGVIYVPVSHTMYYANQETGGWKIGSDGVRIPIKVDKDSTDWISVGSRSHASEIEKEILARYPIIQNTAIGSSLKFCLVAEGQAHIYFRHGPTMEWDTAAGQAILTLSGGQMTTLSGEPLLYNKPSLLNGSFICSAQHLNLRD